MLKKKIAGAGSLDIETCKNYWELVNFNFELKCLLNFLDIRRKVIKKEPGGFDKRKKLIKIIQVGRKISIQKKKWKGSVLVVLAQNLFYNWCLFYTNLSSEISIQN